MSLHELFRKYQCKVEVNAVLFVPVHLQDNPLYHCDRSWHITGDGSISVNPKKNPTET